VKFNVGDELIDVVLNVTLGDETWEFDTDDLTIDQLIAIEDAAGQTPSEWINDVVKNRGRAMKVLVWWLQGRKVPPDSVEFRVGDLTIDATKKATKKRPKAVSGRGGTRGSLAS